jgi:hypothetical protein
MKALIEDYKRRLEEVVDKSVNTDSILEEMRCDVKATCYREFISELERIQIELPTDEEIDRSFTLEITRPMFKPSEKYNEMQKFKREGAKWLRDWIKNNQEIK